MNNTQKLNDNMYSSVKFSGGGNLSEMPPIVAHQKVMSFDNHTYSGANQDGRGVSMFNS